MTRQKRVDFRLRDGRLRVEHGFGSIETGNKINAGQWHHVAAVFPYGAAIKHVKLYVDGVKYGSSGNARKFKIVDDVDVNIGRRGTNGDRYFSGLIDDVAIWGRALYDGSPVPATAWICAKGHAGHFYSNYDTIRIFDGVYGHYAVTFEFTHDPVSYPVNPNHVPINISWASSAEDVALSIDYAIKHPVTANSSPNPLPLDISSAVYTTAPTVVNLTHDTPGPAGNDAYVRETVINANALSVGTNGYPEGETSEGDPSHLIEVNFSGGVVPPNEIAAIANETSPLNYSPVAYWPCDSVIESTFPNPASTPDESGFGHDCDLYPIAANVFLHSNASFNTVRGYTGGIVFDNGQENYITGFGPMAGGGGLALGHWPFSTAQEGHCVEVGAFWGPLTQTCYGTAEERDEAEAEEQANMQV
jgi:hypothetical protein